MKHQTEIFHLNSAADGLRLEGTLVFPSGAPKGIVQISHGMAEHRQRYLPFLDFLADAGYLCAIHDHRGHGGSAKGPEDYGYFGAPGWQGAVSDLAQVTAYLKERYPGLPLSLFAHSMGTMIARIFLKEHDGEIAKLVLCGPPTENKLAGVGIVLARALGALCGGHHRSAFLQSLAFAGYDKKGEPENSWVCANPDTLLAYQADPACGFLFTANGFAALFSLMRECFSKKGWQMRHADLPILLMAGADDPVIQSPAAFEQAAEFLRRRGYGDICTRLYPGMRHELLNERENERIYADVLAWLEE